MVDAGSGLEPIQIVAEGYDEIAHRYLDWSATAPIRLRYLEQLLELLAPGSDVLELGCGAGEPVTRRLAERHPSFDAVVAFYSLTHVPRSHHADLIGRIVAWMRPGGLVLLTMGGLDNPGTVEEDWLGAPMYFSHFDAPTNRALIQRAGVRILSADTVEEDARDAGARFLWVIGRVD